MWKTYNSQRNEIGGQHEIKEWCTLKGIRAEIKNIHWLTKKELAYNSVVVLVFCFLFGVYFYGSDAVIALILKALGMN